MKYRSKPILTTLARNLRKNSTEAEKLLWQFLRNSNIESIKFRRQEPIGDYIVDFVCYKKKLVIELDGGQHNNSDRKEYDNNRTEYLCGMGFKVIRFWNADVMKNVGGVLKAIRKELID